MNRLIFNQIAKRINANKFHISSLTYYAILSIIPTFLLVKLLLNFFHLNYDNNYSYLFDYIKENQTFDIIVFSVITYMISRTFFFMYQNRFSTLKSLIFSFISSVFLVVFFACFIMSQSIRNPLLSILLKGVVTFLFCFLLLYFISKSNLKYSLIFSLSFSVISNIFIYFFISLTTFFLNYEKYYGVFAPFFLTILAIHLSIYLLYITYISSEEFTKISKIKFIKR